MTVPLAARLCLLLLTGALPAAGFAGDWEVVAERDGIVASQRMIEGRNLPQLRAQGEVRGTPYEILAVLLDVPNYHAWVPDCAVATTLGKPGRWRSTIYTRTDLPWPVQDRETVIDQEVFFVRAPTLVNVTFRAIEAPDLAPADGTIRVNSAEGSYTIEALDGRRSRVTYLVDADPGGRVPAWLVVMQSRRNPLGTLAGLRQRLEETRGRYDAEIASYPSGR